MRGIAALAAIAAVIAVRATAVEDDGFPLVLVPQGVTVFPAGGDRVFLRRDGTLTIAAFSRRSPGGGRPVRWCPREEIFWDGKTLWDEQGRYVFGPAPRDLDRAEARIADEAYLFVDPDRLRRARGKSNGEIAGEVFAFYERYKAQRARVILPGESRLVFCPGARS